MSQMRSRTIQQVVGFGYLHLHTGPTMTVLLDKAVVTAVLGFWKARDLSPHTIKLRVQHITQAQAFI